MVELIQNDLKLRGLKDSDKSRLQALCNNKKIWDNLRDFIPYPYTEKDAEDFIALCQKQNPQTIFAIEYNGEFSGCIGLTLQKDIYILTAELGYWIGEPFWGKGIATKAVNMIVDYAFNQLNLIRLFSSVFDFNKASQRVLEKAGFNLECIARKSIIKNGILLDEYKYAKVKE